MAQAHAQPKYMTLGEGGTAAALGLLAVASIVIAARAYTPEYAFHAYLFAAGSVAAIFAIMNRYFERSPDPAPLVIDGKPNYNINTQNLKRITDQLKHINKHVIITAHVKEVKDESSGRILIRPDLTDKVAAAVYGDFDIIGYMTVEEGTWTLRLEPTPTITAKTRVGGLPPVIENPNFGMILNAYEVTRARAKGNN